ncbi:DUF1266 domain-containing protein [Streptomyces sp. NPDC127097]|uniref:DUF1266 domain-containing protein n=1 Tax=Streptomyces sp. NPDC127097 TaxID=3347136 RepID=UPI00364E9A7D
MGIPITGAAAWNVPAQMPPTAVEHALTEAKWRGDWDGYIRVLLQADTFVYVFRERAHAKGRAAPWLPFRTPDGREHIALHTRGELLARRPDVVAQQISLPVPSYEWWGEETAGLLINPGTPSEAYFPDARNTRRHWKALKKQVPQRGHDDDALITKNTGPLHGPLAHGLACGSHLAVHNQVFWNDLGDVYNDYHQDVELLRESWGVTDRANWLQQLTHLLNGQNSPPQPEFALMVRRAIARSVPGAHSDPQLWRQVATDRLRERGAAQEDIAEVQSLIGQIVRYEARFRADGLLPPDGYVTSALGYDYGRAVNFARWGLGARFAEEPEAARAVTAAGELCRERYASWEEFSAGYILGRVLRFDEEAFGHAYGSALSPHRILTTDPGSPWRNIAFGLHAP